MQELIELIKTGNTEALKTRLSDDRTLANSKTEQGISLLQFAAYCRNASAVELLKNFKQELDIFEAASIGDQSLVTHFLDSNPSLINKFSPDGFTPLGLACFFGHIPIVRTLLDNGADPNIASNNPYKVTPLH